MSERTDERRVVVMLSTPIFLDEEQLEPARHVPPGRQWSGWHVNIPTWNAILLGAGHWHPEAT